MYGWWLDRGGLEQAEPARQSRTRSRSSSVGSTSGSRWPPTSCPSRFSAALIAIGFGATRSSSIEGASSRSSARAPSCSPAFQSRISSFTCGPDDVRVDADAADAAELEERHDQVVVARVEVEAGLDDVPRLLEIVVRLLDAADVLDLGELA